MAGGRYGAARRRRGRRVFGVLAAVDRCAEAFEEVCGVHGGSVRPSECVQCQWRPRYMIELIMLDLVRPPRPRSGRRPRLGTRRLKALHYSQPSVSHHLARLEAATGARLLQRVGRGSGSLPRGRCWPAAPRRSWAGSRGGRRVAAPRRAADRRSSRGRLPVRVRSGAPAAAALARLPRTSTCPRRRPPRRGRGGAARGEVSRRRGLPL